jgi:transposase
MASIIHPLLTLLASLTRQELAQQVAYLKAENQILRSKLPDRIPLSNQERRSLVKHGKKLGAKIKDLISIVSYSTFRKWVRSIEDAPTHRAKPKEGKSGRPRVEESISDAILRIRKETNWGYTKIVQALRRLGHTVSRQTVKNVLVQAGLGPPNLQAYVERVIQTLKHEVLNGFCIVSDSHLNHILRTAQEWYNHRRGHSACNHLPPIRESNTPATVDLVKHKLTCVEELGGHLKSYRAAA